MCKRLVRATVANHLAVYSLLGGARDGRSPGAESAVHIISHPPENTLTHKRIQTEL